jgi:hypothetical protein
MKFLKVILIFVMFNTLLMGCTMQMQPIPMNTQVGSVGIAESAKIPLRVAVVVRDPATHKIIYKPAIGAAVDQTGQMGDQLWPLNNELAQASKNVFSQIFKSVTLLRQPPALGGDYDLIITPKLKEVRISMMHAKPFQVNIPFEVYFDWSLMIMDNEGIEIFKREDKTEPKISMSSLSMETHLANMGNASSELMSEMVTAWGRMVYNSREIRAYLKEMEETEE